MSGRNGGISTNRGSPCGAPDGGAGSIRHPGRYLGTMRLRKRRHEQLAAYLESTSNGLDPEPRHVRVVSDEELAGEVYDRQDDDRQKH